MELIVNYAKGGINSQSSRSNWMSIIDIESDCTVAVLLISEIVQYMIFFDIKFDIILYIENKNIINYTFRYVFVGNMLVCAFFKNF